MADAQGWRARLELGYAPVAGRTVPVHRRHVGPLLVQRPFHPEGKVCHSYLLHPPAGVVQGDALEFQVDVAPDAHALVTTPGAGKFYRGTGEACVLQNFRVADGAAYEWLPQETILYAGSRARLETRVSLEGAARYLGWEIICLGRPAAGECFDEGRLVQRLSVKRDGRPLLSEQLVLDGGSAQFAGAWGLQEQPVTATLLCTVDFDAATGEAVCDAAGEPQAGMAGVTVMDGLLVARYLGPQARYARDWFVRLWAALRPTTFGREACAPRIWAT
ncbi:MAG: urease accessory protein UreD [Acidihalobacter sp.]